MAAAGQDPPFPPPRTPNGCLTKDPSPRQVAEAGDQLQALVDLVHEHVPTATIWVEHVRQELPEQPSGGVIGVTIYIGPNDRVPMVSEFFGDSDHWAEAQMEGAYLLRSRLRQGEERRPGFIREVVLHGFPEN